MANRTGGARSSRGAWSRLGLGLAWANVLALAACAAPPPVTPSFPAPGGAGSTGASPPVRMSAPPSEKDTRPAPWVPARLVPRVADACLVQLEAFASERSGNRVMLGPAAFANDSELVLTPVPRRGMDGRLLQGRITTADPVVLNLLVGPEGCVVRGPARQAAGTGGDLGATEERALPACQCQPVGPR